MAEETERRVNTYRGLAEAMAIAVSRAHALAKEDWFPKRDEAGFWSVDDCLRAVVRRRRGESPGGAAATPSAAVIAVAEPPVNELVAAAKAREAPESSAADPRDRETLAAANDPLEVQRAAMRLASRRLADASGKESSRALEDLKRAIEELRRTEDGYLKLARERGELIERDVAKACMGQLGARFVGALARLEARLSLQVEIWGSDVTFRALPPEERARKVRAWVIESSTAARQVEAMDLERMILAEIADRKGT